MNGDFISILLADDHKMYRETLARIVNKDHSFSIIGLLIDITMQPARGYATMHKILSAYPQARIIGLSTFFIDACSQRVMACGAKGYLTRSMPYPNILEGIRKVHEGQTYLCSKMEQD